MLTAIRPVSLLDRVSSAAVRMMLLARSVEAWNPWEHARWPKGHPNAGKFAPMMERLKSAVREFNAGRGGGRKSPLEGFSRDQLMKAAKDAGIELGRGEGEESIAAKLMERLNAPEAPARVEREQRRPSGPSDADRLRGMSRAEGDKFITAMSREERRFLAEDLGLPVGASKKRMLDAVGGQGGGKMPFDAPTAPKAAKKAVAPPVDENSQIVGGRFKHSSVGSNTIFNPNFAAAMEVDRLRADAQPGDADNLRQILTRFKLAELKDIRARVEGAPISGRTKKEIIDDLVGLVGVKSPAGSSGTDLRPPAAGATSGKKATTPAPFDASSTAAALRETVASRADGEAMVAAMRKPELVELGRELSLPGAASMSMARLRREIVEGTVGRRLDSQATRGFKANMPGGAAIDGPKAPAANSGRMTQAQYASALRDEFVRMNELGRRQRGFGRTEDQARAELEGLTIDQLKARNADLRRFLRNQGVDPRTPDQIAADNAASAPRAPRVTPPAPVAAPTPAPSPSPAPVAPRQLPPLSGPDEIAAAQARVADLRVERADLKQQISDDFGDSGGRGSAVVRAKIRDLDTMIAEVEAQLTAAGAAVTPPRRFGRRDGGGAGPKG